MRTIASLVLISFAPALASAQRNNPFSDTLGGGLGGVGPGPGFQTRTFRLTSPPARDSLKNLIARQRSAWQSAGIKDYRVVVREACFCPGLLGWLLYEVKGGKTVKVSKPKGGKVAVAERMDYNIDRIFDYLAIDAERNDVVEVAFDSTFHFPVYIRTDLRLGLPDDWGIVDIRGFTPAGQKR